MANTPYKTIADYIGAQDPGVQDRLGALWTCIRNACPEAEESLAWAMPTFKYRGVNLVHFAAHKNHIGLYPGPEGVALFTEREPGFKTSKGGVQLPHDKPLPLVLIGEIVRLRGDVIRKG